MSESPTEMRSRPWYRELWPWLLMLPPAAAVAGGVAMVVLASHTPSALVVEDYARIEALTSERFERDSLAADYGLTATLTFAADPSRVDVVLASPEWLPRPPVLLLRLRHATNPALDRELELVFDGDAYRAASDFAPGRYHVELMPADRAWRLGGDVTPSGGAITLRAQGAAGASAAGGRRDPGDPGD